MDGRPDLRRNGAILALVTVMALIVGTAAVAASLLAGDERHVGRQPDGSVLTSTNQTITPAGLQAEFPGRPHTVAIRPDGKTAALLVGGGGGVAATTASIVVIDTTTAEIIQSFDPGTGEGSFRGIIYSPDGTKLYASSVGGSIAVADVAPDGTLTAGDPINLPTTNGNPYPAGLALDPTGQKLYVALNRNNTLGVVDLESRSLKAEIPVGNAPHEVVVRGATAYVSNQGGRRAVDGDTTNRSGGTTIVSNPTTGGAATGTVSVVDLSTGSVTDEIPVGLHPTAMTFASDRLFVANTNSDSISVIDPETRSVTSTIAVHPFPSSPFGSSPNGLAMLPGNRLVVSLGRNNALAFYTWRGEIEPATFEGLIPTAWYPSDVAIDPNRQVLVVSNDKGVGSLGPVAVTDPPVPNPPKIASSNLGSASVIAFPDAAALDDGVDKVFANNGWDDLSSACQGDPDAQPHAIPPRIGDPSPIEHVFYIVKENRTYDQVMGDDIRGNGDPSLTTFGLPITPNQHMIATEFPLLDNFYVSGSLSADGHQWVTQAFVTDYIEKSFSAFDRSYPFDGGDSMAYAPTGFLWENAVEHGKSVKVYGEYANGRNTDGETTSDVPSLDDLLVRDYPPYDLSIADTTRADIFLEDFAAADAAGEVPNLTIIQLPLNHTLGSSPDAPSPLAEIANNDLAVGRVVEAISHSDAWARSAIFIVEDDAQAGVDHVDGHRTTAFIASPYARRGVVDSSYYTQINMVRTMEQILGLPPMNQMDLAAAPMFSAFTDTADTTGYDALKVPPEILELKNPPLHSLSGIERAWARASMRMDFSRPDAAPEQLLNRAIFYATTDFKEAYPGDPRILRPGEVDQEIAPGGEEFEDGAEEVEEGSYGAAEGDVEEGHLDQTEGSPMTCTP